MSPAIELLLCLLPGCLLLPVTVISFTLIISLFAEIHSPSSSKTAVWWQNMSVFAPYFFLFKIIFFYRKIYTFPRLFLFQTSFFSFQTTFSPFKTTFYSGLFFLFYLHYYFRCLPDNFRFLPNNFRFVSDYFGFIFSDFTVSSVLCHKLSLILSICDHIL